MNIFRVVIVILFACLLILSAQTVFAGNQQQDNFYPAKRTIMIDLDGVLDNYSKFDENEIPEIRQGAKDFVKTLYSTGKYDLILFTTRSPKLALNWLIKNNIDKYFKDVTNVKIPAYIYIDDRGLKFNGNYEETLKQIENFKTYWK